MKGRKEGAKFSASWREIGKLARLGNTSPHPLPLLDSLHFSPCVSIMSQHCFMWLGVCIMMTDWHLVSSQSRFEQLHTCCLWLRPLCQGTFTYRCHSARLYLCMCACVCALRALPGVLHYASSPGMDLMGREEKADEASPEAAYNVSNTWSAMSPGGHIGLVPHPSVSLLTSKCILGRSRGSFAHS